MQGIEPCTSRMQSERSTIWATSPFYKDCLILVIKIQRIIQAGLCLLLEQIAHKVCNKNTTIQIKAKCWKFQLLLRASYLEFIIASCRILRWTKLEILWTIKLPALVLDLQEHRIWKFLFCKVLKAHAYATFVQISSVDFNSALAWQRHLASDRQGFCGLSLR